MIAHNDHLLKMKKEDLSPLCIIISFYYILPLDFYKSMNTRCFFVLYFSFFCFFLLFYAFQCFSMLFNAFLCQSTLFYTNILCISPFFSSCSLYSFFTSNSILLLNFLKILEYLFCFSIIGSLISI